MARLIPLSDILHSARQAEKSARAAHNTRAAALEAAEYEIAVAPGCHSGPYFDPPRIGWVLSAAAANAIAQRMTHMPDGTSHCRAQIWSRPQQEDE